MEETLIVFNGIRFRRYPNAKQRTDRVYFTPGIADKQRGIGRLHEEIWKSIHGPIPDGYHVHHADHDALNNDPTNLVCIPSDDHHRHHGNDPEHQAQRQSDEWLAHLEAIRPLAAAWHSTPEGMAWHSQHGRDVMDARPKVTATCEHCGNSYESKQPDRFCSNKCKTAWRRAAGLDNEERACLYCQTVFTVNRYAKTKFCSRSCSAKHQHSKT